MRKILAPLALVGVAVSVAAAQAQPPAAPSPDAVPAGVYAVESYHTQVGFSVLHFFVSHYDGVFSKVSGQLKLDPKNLDASALEVSVPVDSVQTTSDKLDGELKGEQWLDAGKFPTMTFRSTKITRSGPDTATVAGDLTLHGVTKPVVLTAKFVGAGANPMDKSFQVGFAITGQINRSDFGVKTYVPMISDQVDLGINAAFRKAP